MAEDYLANNCSVIRSQKATIPYIENSMKYAGALVCH